MFKNYKWDEGNQIDLKSLTVLRGRHGHFANKIFIYTVRSRFADFMQICIDLIHIFDGDKEQFEHNKNWFSTTNKFKNVSWIKFLHSKAASGINTWEGNKIRGLMMD